MLVGDLAAAAVKFGQPTRKLATPAPPADRLSY